MVLVLVLALSCFAVAGVSAAEEFTPSEEPVIYFEVPEHWKGDISKVFCHIWPYGGEGGLANWGSKKETCKATETEGLYSYDISKVGTLEADTLYCVIFCVTTSTGSELQTYNTYFDTNCFGDTLYCDDTIYENPTDSAKTCQAAFWKNQDKTVYGPELCITSIGNIVGSALPSDVTAVDLLNNFVADGTLDNALLYVDKTAEELLTEIATKLEISDEDLADIIASLNASSDDEATGDEATGDEATGDEVLLGDADGDTKVNVKDATAVQKQVAGFEITINTTAADADRNGSVNVKDATAIQKWVAGIAVSTPIGELITIG